MTWLENADEMTIIFIDGKWWWIISMSEMFGKMMEVVVERAVLFPFQIEIQQKTWNKVL